MNRRSFVTAALGAAAASRRRAAAPATHDRSSLEQGPITSQGGFELEETTLAQLRTWLTQGRYSARRLAELYLSRIEELDRRGPMLRAVIEVNPDALEIADRLDGERRERGERGPLHGIPVLIKDNVDTADRMHTSAGSLALAGSVAPSEAFVAQRLRAAGAVILGKTNMSEWANFRSTKSSSGWSARGGQCRNPCVLDRSPSGSSSGSAVAAAASMCAAAVGTETDGSITSPAAASHLVGIKPTVGLVSRSGIIPIAHSQDTAGPIARTVADAAILLGVLAGEDVRDPATRRSAARAASDYTSFLDPDALRGARLGVARKRYTGYNGHVDNLFDAVLRVLRERGALIVDPAELATEDHLHEAELTVLLYEFKADLNAYLAALGPAAPVKSLAEVIAFNEREREREMPYFAQELMVRAQEKGPLTAPAYRTALATCRRWSRALGIDATMRRHRLDAIICPTQAPAWPIDLVNGDSIGGNCTTPASVAGYPHVTVPMGDVFGLPVGLSFMGRAWSEGRLIGLAYAFEQATRARRPPAFAPTVSLGAA